MKLLNKSIRSHLLYAGIVLLVAIPVLYFVILKIVEEDVDESLMAHKEQIVSKLEAVIHNDPFSFLDAFEPNLTISPAAAANPYDSFYSIKVYDKISEENIPYRILESNVLIKKTPYLIKLKSSLLDSRDLIATIVTVMVVLLLLIIVGLILINRGLSKKLWNPFYKTLDRLHHFRIDKPEPAHFERTTIDEFTDLNNTITALTQRNQQVYQSQKEFIENASHEMQTPLAIFQNKLELLMQTQPLSAEQAFLMEELADTAQRMNRLNKSLLLLSKIDNNQFGDVETISLNSIISKLIEQYKFQIDKREIGIVLRNQQDILLPVNKTLIEILAGNLLSNAIRHTVSGGKILITSEENKLIIENSAAGGQLDTDKLFLRFHKQSSGPESTGLGLAIAKKITSLYHYNLAYSFANNFHRFTLQFS